MLNMMKHGFYGLMIAGLVSLQIQASSARAEAERPRVVIGSSAELTQAGLVSRFFVRNTDSLNTKQIDEIDAVLAQVIGVHWVPERIAPRPLGLPMTASDAMARHWLQERYVEGNDTANIDRLMAMLQAARTTPRTNLNGTSREAEEPLGPDQEAEIKRLFRWALDGERENPDHMVLYHGASGLEGFLYELYRAAYNLLVPQETCKLRVRPFDKGFFSCEDAFSLKAFDASHADYNSHRLFSSMSVFHGLAIGKGGSSAQYCALHIEGDTRFLSGKGMIDFPGFLSSLFGPLGIALTDDEIKDLKFIRDTYFKRGILMQLLSPPELFNQYVRHAGTYAQEIPIERLVAEGCAEPTLQFVKDFRSGKAPELKARRDALEIDCPFEAFEGNIYTHPNLLNHPDVKVQIEYSPDFPDAEKAAFSQQLDKVLQGILQRGFGTAVEDVHESLYPFHRQYRAAYQRLQDRYHLVHVAVPDEEVSNFIETASPQTLLKYIEDYPDFLARSIPSADASSPTKLIRDILFDSLHSKINYSLIANIVCKNPAAFNLSDTRIADISQWFPDLKALVESRKVAHAGAFAWM